MIAARLVRQEQWASWDVLLIALALAHGGLLLLWPSIPLIGIGMWWNANSISHNVIHRPFFRRRELNAIFSCLLTVVLGLPQSFWRARHLAHHLARERAQRRRLDELDLEAESDGKGRRGVGSPRSIQLEPLDVGAVIALWAGLLGFAPGFMLTVYLPGFLLGLALCYLQGHYEHARGTVSNYGRLYNLMFFNDGYHIEHHARPGAHWRELSRQRAVEGCVSRWPAVLRWLECLNLCALERLVLRSPALQRFVLNRHERAFRRLLADSQSVRRVGIVGGGLFPRTAMILSRLFPDAKLALIDLSADNLAVARRFVAEAEFINQCFEPDNTCDFDLLVIPLAFNKNRETIYQRPPATLVVVHDWIWRRRGSSAIVSWLLLKRMNLVTQ
ncbi:MAG: fatty acid desaturase [Blastocatellia bacterium]